MDTLLLAGIAQEVLCLTNEFRADHDLAPLRLNPELTTTAQNHSQAMADDDFFDHVSLDGSEPWDRAAAAGYTAQTLGENIAAGQATPEQVFQSWVASEGHRQNLLNPNYTELGVGYVALENDTGDINYGHYWTQVFGSGNLTFNQSTNPFGLSGNLQTVDGPENSCLIEVLTLTDEGKVQLSDTLSYRLDMAPGHSQQWLLTANTVQASPHQASPHQASMALIQIDSSPAITDGHLWIA